MALDFFAGCLGGCAGVAVGHPLDTVKVRLQIQSFSNPQFRGTWHCFSDTVKKESVRGLYKGMSSPMAGVAGINAIIFGVHGNILKRVKDPNSLQANCIAGCVAGFAQSFMASPVELVKLRVQIQAKGVGGMTTDVQQYKSPLDCAKKVFKTEGFKGLFRGQIITIIRDVPGLSCYFVSYEVLSRSMASADGKISSLAILTAGGMAGIVSWLFSYPVDVIKSRLQADGMNGVNKYKGMYDCLQRSISSEGLGVLTRGVNSTIIRAFPTNAATFAVVNWTIRMCQQQQQDDDMQGHALNQILTLGDGLLNVSGHQVPIGLGSSQTSLASNVSLIQPMQVEAFQLPAHLEKFQEQECDGDLSYEEDLKHRHCCEGVLGGTWTRCGNTLRHSTRACFTALVNRHMSLGNAL